MDIIHTITATLLQSELESIIKGYVETQHPGYSVRSVDFALHPASVASPYSTPYFKGINLVLERR